MSSETSLPWLVQNKPSAPIRRVENKVEFLERQFHSEKLSFVHKKETEHSFELSLSICVFIGVFSILSAKLWSWKLPHDERAPAILLMDDISRCQIGFFPHPLNGWQDHWTFEGEWVMGDFTDLVWEFFSASYVMSDISFSAGYFFPGIYLLAFLLLKSVCRTFFFLKSPNNLR